MTDDLPEHLDALPRQLSRAEIADLNATLPAGSPMVFACRSCGQPIWVPELYLAKPVLCPSCGGEWSDAR